MAIQMRQGNEVDFDAEKMLPGEWAVSTDAKIVRICFAPGIVARMATYEAFEADMVKIEAILKNVQDIQTAVKLVQAEINGKSELVAENASLAEEYMLKSKEYAEQAGAFTGMQIAKRDLLGVVKGGDMAVEDDGALRNFKRGAGNTFAVSDTVESPFSAYKLYGKSVQDGVPTPDNPQPIVSVGEKLVDGVVTEVGIGNEICGKNLLDNISSLEIFDLVGDGSILRYGRSFEGGKTYTVTNQSGELRFIRLPSSDFSDRGSTISIEHNASVNVTVDSNHILWFFCNQYAISTMDNCMVAVGSDVSYSPYTGQSHTLSKSITLHGIGDVRDELTPDGVVRKFKKVVFDGSDDEEWEDAKGNAPFGIKISDIKPALNGNLPPNAICTHYIPVSNVADWSQYDYLMSYFGGDFTLIRFRNIGISSLDEWKAELHSNPITVVYELATPITEPLPEADQIALRSLHSYDGVTTVMSDAWAEVECATSNVAALAMYIKRDYVPKAKYDELESRISALEQQIVNA